MGNLTDIWHTSLFHWRTPDFRTHASITNELRGWIMNGLLVTPCWINHARQNHRAQVRATPDTMRRLVARSWRHQCKKHDKHTLCVYVKPTCPCIFATWLQSTYNNSLSGLGMLFGDRYHHALCSQPCSSGFIGVFLSSVCWNHRANHNLSSMHGISFQLHRPVSLFSCMVVSTLRQVTVCIVNMR